MSVRLFLSYARTDDEPFVWRLYEGLKSAGFEVWFDRVSMPSRQLKFDTEIENAIIAQDRLVLVVGPGAIASDYVTHEWRFAFHQAVKCVNPIVRLNGKDAAGKPIDAYDLIPEDLRGPHAEDFRDDAQFDLHLQNLIRQVSDPLPPVGKLVAVPELPPNYLEQRDRLASLRDMLLADLRKPVVVTGGAGRVGLQGMGGIGKSVLACALARRPEIRRAFPDGVLWVTLGQKPDLVDLQRKLVKAGFDVEPDFTSEQTGKERLRDLLKERAALIVLDDAWQRDHAEAFNVIGPRCRLLLTTRDAGLVTALASQEHHYQVHLPAEAEALEMLARAAGVAQDALPDAARQVMKECGRLPLALALCGGMAGHEIPWSDIREAIREHDLEYPEDRHAVEEQHQTLWRAMGMSIRVLPEAARRRFAELAVFGLDMGAPEEAVITLWEHTTGMKRRHAISLLAEFAERSLIQRDSTTGHVGLHDLLHNFATAQAVRELGSESALHELLVKAYAKKCPAGWPSGPNDGYYFENLCHHLREAGRLDEVVELLTGLEWIEDKAAHGLAAQLPRDYRETIVALPEAQGELREEARRQAEVARWTKEIIEYARTADQGATLPRVIESVPPWTDEQIEAECERIRSAPTRLDVLKAFARFVEQECFGLGEFGARPGFVVQQAYNHAPAGPVHRRAQERASRMTTPILLRRWPSNAAYNPKPAILRTVQTTRDSTWCLSTTPDWRWAVWGNSDGTLHLWDLQTSTCLRTLEGHSSLVTSACVMSDGRLAVSGSVDKTLRVWNLETGACLRILKGHTDTVSSLVVTPDGRRAVSGSDDHTLRVWDLETGECLRILLGHTDKVMSLSVTPDGRRAASGSADHTLRVWNLQTGTCLCTLEGHKWAVISVSLTADGRRAVSGSGDQTLRSWDLESGACLRTMEGHAGGVYSVSVTPDGRQAVSGSVDQTLRVWDLGTGACSRTLEGLAPWAISVCVSPDGRRALLGSRDRTLREYDLETGASKGTLESHLIDFRDAFVISDGRRLVAKCWDDMLRVWETATGACLHTLVGHTALIWSLSVTPDGRRAVSSSEDKTLRVWDLETGACLRTLEGHTKRVVFVYVTPDGRMAVSYSSDKTLRLWDLETGASLQTRESPSEPARGVCMMPDGRQVVLGSGYQTLWVWDLQTGACVRTLEDQGCGGETYVCMRVSIVPDRRRVVSADTDRILRVWDLETGACLRTLKGHSGGISSVSVTPNGRWVVSSSGDKTLRVWDLETGNCVALMRSDVAIEVAAADSASKLVAGSATGEIAVFELRGLD